MPTVLPSLVGSLATLAVVHGWLLRGPWRVEPAVNLGLLLADVMLLGNYILRYRHESPATRVLYFAGAGVLLAMMRPLLTALPENVLLAVMVLTVYAGLFARPFLTGYLFLFVGCSVFAAAYRFETFVLGAAVWTGSRPLGRMIREDSPLVPVFYVAGTALLVLLLLPVLYFATQSSPQSLAKTAAMPDVRAALVLTLWTATASVAGTALLAVPLAYVLVRLDFPGRGVLTALVDLPLLIPPPVAGIALVAFLGENTPLGRMLAESAGLKFVSTVGGIIAVQVFVGAPFLVRSAMIAFQGVDPHYERVARTLGASAWRAFRTVALPPALPGIAMGAALMWFRAAGEFGATYLIAPSPETGPMLVYKLHQTAGSSESHPVAVLVLLAFVSLFAGLGLLLRSRVRPQEAAA